MVINILIFALVIPNVGFSALFLYLQKKNYRQAKFTQEAIIVFLPPATYGDFVGWKENFPQNKI